jgi:hypothetical protein
MSRRHELKRKLEQTKRISRRRARSRCAAVLLRSREPVDVASRDSQPDKPGDPPG